MIQTLIEKQTAAATSDTYFAGGFPKYPKLPITLYLLGVIGTGEAITVEYPDGAAWREWKEDGETVVLDENNTVITIHGAAVFRLNKPITAAPVGVGVAAISS